MPKWSDAPASGQDSSPRPGLPAWALLAVLMIAELTSAAEASMIYAALPTFYREFGDPIGVGWLLSGFMLVSAAAAALCSRLGDLYGRSRVLIAVLAVAAAGSLIGALSDTLDGIILGRTVQGFSGAILPLCFGLVRENLPKARVPTAIGIVAATATVGAGASFLAAGLFIDRLSWHWIFYGGLALAVVALVLVTAFLPASPRKKSTERLDLVGGLLFVPAVSLILFSITKLGIWGWSDPWTIGLMAGGFVLMVGWVLYELRHPSPLIDVRLLADRQIGLTNLAYGLVALGALQLAQVMLILLQQPVWTGVGLGASALMAATIKQPSTFIGVVAGPWAGYLAGRHGARVAILIGTGLLTAGWIGLVVDASSIWLIAALTLVVSYGISMVYSAVPNLIIETTPPERTSEAVGMAQVVRATGMSIGSQVVTYLLATSTISDPTKGTGVYPDAAAFQLCLTYIAITGALSAVVAIFLPARPQPGWKDARQAA